VGPAGSMESDELNGITPAGAGLPRPASPVPHG